MMDFFRWFSGSQMVRGSLLIFLGNNIGNFFNFLYNILMARMLGPKIYGDLGVILSVLAFIGIPLGILHLFLVKIVSSYWGKNDVGAIHSLFSYFTWKLFIVWSAVGFLFIVFHQVILDVLRLDMMAPIAIIAILIAFSGVGTLNRAILQGSLSFLYLTVVGIAEVLLKLIFATGLVFFGYQLVGALAGMTLSGTIIYFLSLIQIKRMVRNAQGKKFALSWKLLSSFTPVLFSMIILTTFISADIILVRRFFPATVAGEYVALSTVGKITFYAVGPLISVMFPLVSARKSAGLPYLKPLFGTLLVSLALSSLILILYFLFPKFIVGIIFGEKYYGIVPYLGLFSVSICIYSLNSILTHFLLSVSASKSIYTLCMISLVQIVGILAFHESISQVLWVNIFSSFIYFLAAFIFVWQIESAALTKRTVSRILKKVGNVFP